MAGARELARRLSAQGALARILAGAPSLSRAAPELLAALGENLGWQVGVLWEADGKARALTCFAVWGARPTDAGVFERACLQLSIRPGTALPGRVWRSGVPEWIPDLLAEPAYVRRAAAVEVGLRAGLAFPIACRGRRLGVIELYAREPRRPDPGLLDLVGAVGSQLGLYIDRTHAEEAVRRSEARKSAILDAALDGIVAMDASGRVVEFNPAAERMFGHRRADAVGRRLADLIIPPALRIRHREGLARHLATGESRVLGRRLRMVGMRADGTEFPVEVAVSRVEPFRDLFIGCVRDLSGEEAADRERKRILSRDRAARTAAQAAEERARRLMADASTAQERERRRISEALHDGVLQDLLAARQELREAARGDPHALAHAEQALIRTTAQLREAVLDLHPVALEQLGLASVLTALAERIALRAGFRVEVDVDAAAAGVHDALVVALAREWLTNAMKHSGAAVVGVTVARSGDGIVLEVADDGRGIAPGRPEEALRQGHIGLASSAERLAAMGGALQLLSVPAGGTRVRGVLPLPGDPGEGPSGPPAPSPSSRER